MSCFFVGVQIFLWFNFGYWEEDGGGGGGNEDVCGGGGTSPHIAPRSYAPDLQFSDTDSHCAVLNHPCSCCL